MTHSTLSSPPKSFWIICIIALLWNISGVYSFFMEVFITPEALAALPEAQRLLYETNPVWMTVVFAIAVLDGTLGCVLLLMKKALAGPVLITSLVAVLIQMSYWIFMTNSLEVYGPTGIIMPVIVSSIAAFLVWYAYKAKANSWIG
jgi:hypothetical protein